MARALLLALAVAAIVCAMTVPAAAKKGRPCDQHTLNAAAKSIETCSEDYVNSRVRKMCAKHVKQNLSELTTCSLAGASSQLRECFEAVRLKEAVFSKAVICTTNSMSALEWATQCCN